MKRSFARLLLAAAAVAALVPAGASADHGCNGNVTAVESPAGTIYVDDRGAASTNVWIYAESNGVAGLQSGGDQAAGLWDDGCSHDNPDTLLF